MLAIISAQPKDMKLVGAHVIGEQATELANVAMMAMWGGLNAESLEDACFNTPTLGELYATAARAALEQELIDEMGSQYTPGNKAMHDEHTSTDLDRYIA